MPGRLIVVSGTDTDIGKTHLACALLLHAKSVGRAALGYKPVESGVGATESDAARLAAASAETLSPVFHVKQAPTLSLRLPISPHLAAEAENLTVPWLAIRDWIQMARAEVDLLVELPGGLFTPFSAERLNIDAVAELQPDVTILVAPDRLGVLHQVGASLAGALHHGIHVDAVALVAPQHADASTGTNVTELRRLTPTPILGPWPRASAEELASSPLTRTLASLWLP